MKPPVTEIDPSPERLAAARLQRRRGRRFGWLLGDKIFDRIRTDFGLRFLHEVLGLEQLSYGLWDDEELNLQGLKTAQDRYAELIRTWIPDGVKTVLDVGCGTGATAIKLAEDGREVEGLSPDPFQEQLFTRRTGRPFHLVRFELFEPDHPFDLVLTSESAQYIMLDQLFRAITKHSPGAYLLVADYFRVAEGSGPAAKSGHPLEDFLDEAGRWGFTIEREEDLTDRVAPTLEFGRQCVDRHVLPTIEIVRDSTTSSHPLLSRVAGLFLRPAIRSWTKQMQLLDKDEFVRTKRYMAYLFKSGERSV